MSKGEVKQVIECDSDCEVREMRTAETILSIIGEISH